MTKIFSALCAGVALLAFAGMANAQQPMQLSDAQLDHVTAGATSNALGQLAGSGTIFASGFISLATAVAGSTAAGAGTVLMESASFSGTPTATAASALGLALTSP